MKRILILLTLILFTACSGISSNSDTVLNTQETLYEQSDFNISIDSYWEIIEENKFTSSIPQNTVVVFRNNMQNEIFTANINISRITISDSSTVKDFALNSLEEARNSLSSFTEISTEEHKVTYGDSSVPAYRVVFQGKEHPSSVKVRFDQTFIINNNIGYTVTGAYIPKEEESVVNNIEEMIESFSLK